VCPGPPGYLDLLGFLGVLENREYLECLDLLGDLGYPGNREYLECLDLLGDLEFLGCLENQC